jgi:putative transposase
VQAQSFAQAAGTCRFAYNWGLAEWQRQMETFSSADKSSVKNAFLATKSSQFHWVDALAPSLCDSAFDELDAAMKGFRQGRSSTPRFKKKRDSQMTFRVAERDFFLEGHSLFIPGLGSVNMTEELRFSGEPFSATITRDVTGDWFVTVRVRLAQHQSGRQADQQPRWIFENQEHLAEAEKQLSRLERSLSRKRRGSRRWKKARLRVHRTYRRIRHIRQDGLYKLATDLATYYRLGGRDDPPSDGERHSEPSLYS